MFPDSAIIYGKNGAGKTFLFESLNKEAALFDNKETGNFVISNSDRVKFIDRELNISYRIEQKISEKFYKIASLIPIEVLNNAFKENGWGVNNINFKSIEIENILIKAKEIKTNYFKYFPYTPGELKVAINGLKKLDITDEEKKNLQEILLINITTFDKKDYIDRNINDISIIINVLDNIYEKYDELLRGNFLSKIYDEMLDGILELYNNGFYKTVYLLEAYCKLNERDKIEINFDEMKISGTSFGIDRYNNLIKIFEESNNDMSRTIVMDDPFDSFNHFLKLKLVDNMVSLSKKGFKFIITTNDLTSFQLMMSASERHGNQFEGIYIEQIGDDPIRKYTSIEEPNLLFKWNNDKYYKELAKMIKSPKISGMAKNLILSIHREIMDEYLKLSSIIDKDEKNKEVAINWTSSVYSTMSNFLKESEFKSDTLVKINDGVISRIAGNYKISELSTLLNFRFSNIFFNRNIKNILYIRALLKPYQLLVIQGAKEIINKTIELIKEKHLKFKMSEKYIEEMNNILKTLSKFKLYRNNLIHERMIPAINSLSLESVDTDLFEKAFSISNQTWFLKTIDRLMKDEEFEL